MVSPVENRTCCSNISSAGSTGTQLVEFVRQCWERITPLVTAPPHERTVVDQFADLADKQDDLDAATYASEAALKAAGWAPSIREEQAQQAELLRRIVGNPFRECSPAGNNGRRGSLGC